jgi:asparagine synthase (glutamine-hydrolysing)
MCGIFGILRPRGEVEPPMQRMLAATRHRGPDGEGIERPEGATLGHVRLAIIDPSPAGRQPMVGPSGRTWITFNGEIYNYRELRAECIAAGIPIRTGSDTEVLLGLYELLGEGAFDRLEGIFAFALHDLRSGESWLVRDRFGVKPLHYAETPAGIVFASELRGLLASGLVPPEIDPGSLSTYLRLDSVPAPATILRGVRRLRGGHLLRVERDGGIESSPFAKPEDPSPVHPPASGEEDLRGLESRLDDAVLRQLVSDVPVGVFLSGGLDSAAVASSAARATGGAIEAFSIGFEDRSFDESGPAREVAKRLGLRHHLEVVRDRDVLDLVPRLASLASEPLADGSLLPTNLLARFARERVKVALSGDGGDELLGGYPTHAIAPFAALPSRLPAGLRRSLSAALRRILPAGERNFSFDFRLRKLVEGLDPDPILRNARWLGSFQPEELPRLLVDFDPSHLGATDRLLHEPSAEAAGCNPLERILRTDQRFYLGDGVLQKVDRASMAVALEVRVPLLDRELVRFAQHLPANRKIRGTRTKVLLRQLVESRLGAEVASRPKKGFGAPFSRWFRGELRPLVEEILSARRIADGGLFRPEFVRRLVDDHMTRRADERKRILNLLVLELWRDAARAWAAEGKPNP